MRDKTELRAELAEVRADAFGACPDAGERLAANFPSSIAIADQAVVAGYMPFRSEIVPLPLLRMLSSMGAQSAMPRMNSPSSAPIPSLGWGEGKALSFHICDFTDQNHFTANKWGLLEPHAYLPTVTPTILLVPLLGFDRKGNRIGYGKGYYDEAITSLRATNNITTIGIGFAQQEVPEIPTQPHDQRLDWIITQNEAYRVPS
jgi:5-formyltetrahydrofolate cyclo-ligase